MKCDLHCHTIYSFDSTQSVDDVINRAKNAGISVLAICDHNTCEGSIEASKQSDVEIIPAVEIDCFCEDTIIHVTAYGMDVENQYFKDLKTKYIKELENAGSIRKKLIEEKYGCKLDDEKIKAYTHFGYPYTNVEIEKVLFEDCNHPALEIYKTGEKSSNPLANFYWEHLAIGKWGYVEMKLPDYKEVIKQIHDLNGICICAHPKITIARNEKLIQLLIDEGIDGFEAYCSYHDKDDAAFYEDLCKCNNLCMTVGSDFHGLTKPNIELGDTGYQGDCSQIIIDLKRRIKEMQS
jgi:3',5'-nucleoside bisphosphate phosphatase